MTSATGRVPGASSIAILMGGMAFHGVNKVVILSDPELAEGESKDLRLPVRRERGDSFPRSLSFRSEAEESAFVLALPEGVRGLQPWASFLLPTGRSNGNRITSRMDLEPVRTMVRRSMPTPSPAVGGRP